MLQFVSQSFSYTISAAAFVHSSIEFSLPISSTSDDVTHFSTTFEIVEGDLTIEEVECIVNPANEYLRHGGGLARAILNRGGPEQNELSREWVVENGPVALGGGSAVTQATGDLRCDFVVHVVGPRVPGDVADEEDEELLRGAVRAALVCAMEDLGCRSIGLPAISSGIFGYPVTDATRAIVDEAFEYVWEMGQNGDTEAVVELVRFVALGDATIGAFVEGLGLVEEKFKRRISK